MRLTAIVMLVLCAGAGMSQTPVETQPIKQLIRTGTLGTSIYAPTSMEQPFFKHLDKNEIATGSFMEPYSIHGKVGKFVSWFGIVRGITVSSKDKDELTVLLDQKYFDGMTDSHIMLVSYSGGGDFSAVVHADPSALPPLPLVRIYGKVEQEIDNVPHLSAEYVHVWPWLTFTFTDLGDGDKSNPIWAKYSKFPAGGRVYNPYPGEDYYLRMLGDPKFFGLNWKPDR